MKNCFPIFSTTGGIVLYIFFIPVFFFFRISEASSQLGIDVLGQKIRDMRQIEGSEPGIQRAKRFQRFFLSLLQLYTHF